MFSNNSNNNMDDDPPSFQKDSVPSNEDTPYHFQDPPPPRLPTSQSSSADDYRNVIDDLTVEIQKLKEELISYKQKGPEMLRKDELFEMKYHSLPKRKRRELETTLRDFADGVGDSLNASSYQRKKSWGDATRDRMYSRSGYASKQALSSSGSKARPVDSAYASMSRGAHSSGMSLMRSTTSSCLKSDQRVENFLPDVPEGLSSSYIILTERDKKKLVVQRLEQLFTGKIGGRHARQDRKRPADGPEVAEVIAAGAESQPRSVTGQLAPALRTIAANAAVAPEPLREARILLTEQLSGDYLKESRSRDNGSASNSNGAGTESGGHHFSIGRGTNTSPTEPPVPDQRPTSVKDLDPDRAQIPSENMNYIRHLGLFPPKLMKESYQNKLAVQPGTPDWVYLNLLCSLAQLHIINVTPSFVRSAVAEISKSFQLSPDGRKIRWHGGQDGTRFYSDSFDENAHNSPGTEGFDSGQRKRQKTIHTTRHDNLSDGSSKGRSKVGPLVSTSSVSFHYQPHFVHDSSRKWLYETLLLFRPVNDGNLDDSRLGLSGSNTSNRRKRRHDGAITYYRGAPFCIDLSGDPDDTSSATYMMSSGQDRQDSHSPFAPPVLQGSVSSPCLSLRPLSEMSHSHTSDPKTDVDFVDCLPTLPADSESEASIMDDQFPRTQGRQFIEIQPLEPCGLGGVMPDDHFMVVVTTKRSTKDAPASESGSGWRHNSEDVTKCIIGRLASAYSRVPPATSQASACPVEIEYLSGRIRSLTPVPLPPPVLFLPSFSADMSSLRDDSFTSEDDREGLKSSELVGWAVNPRESDGYLDGVDLNSDDDGEEPAESDLAHRIYVWMDTHEGEQISLNRRHPQDLAALARTPEPL